mmetsp:Transcript_732/g.1939  ORF Transcript_732/g.1939 Transcript_732/m.1939 type:complete len:278 (+) Transcript_732:351-1184(+)
MASCAVSHGRFDWLASSNSMSEKMTTAWLASVAGGVPAAMVCARKRSMVTSMLVLPPHPSARVLCTSSPISTNFSSPSSTAAPSSMTVTSSGVESNVNILPCHPDAGVFTSARSSESAIATSIGSPAMLPDTSHTGTQHPMPSPWDAAVLHPSTIPRHWRLASWVTILACSNASASVAGSSRSSSSSSSSSSCPHPGGPASAPPPRRDTLSQAFHPRSVTSCGRSAPTLTLLTFSPGSFLARAATCATCKNARYRSLSCFANTRSPKRRRQREGMRS